VPAAVREGALARMREVQGWLSDGEADLLVTATSEALAGRGDTHALVEVGSFCGRATTVLASVIRALRPTGRIWAIDPHDGVVGAVGQGLQHEGPTLERFRQNMARVGLSDLVETVQSRAADVPWERPVCLLLIDGLHDYGNVCKDFRHFEAHLVEGALIAFHDYAPYFPGVVRFVDELIAGGDYSLHARADSMIVLRRQAPVASATMPPPELTAEEGATPAPALLAL
jgi:hypothetical protein